MNDLPPTLDEIADDPSRVKELSSDLCAAVAGRLAIVAAAIFGRVAAVSGVGSTQIAEGNVELLDIPAVAQRLQVPKSYAYELARRGDLPSVRVGGKYVRVAVRDLDEWLARQRNRCSGSIPPPMNRRRKS